VEAVLLHERLRALEHVRQHFVIRQFVVFGCFAHSK